MQGNVFETQRSNVPSEVDGQLGIILIRILRIVKDKLIANYFRQKKKKKEEIYWLK